MKLCKPEQDIAAAAADSIDIVAVVDCEAGADSMSRPDSRYPIDSGKNDKIADFRKSHPIFTFISFLTKLGELSKWFDEPYLRKEIEKKKQDKRHEIV